MRVSTVNLVATATVTASSEDPFWLAANLKAPQRCFLPTRTAALGDQTWVIDYGSAKAVEGWGIINVNFASAKIQANATDSWGAPSYDSGLLALGRNPYTGRYAYTHLSAQTFRYHRLVVPSQTPVDGAAYYAIGGLHAGLLPSVPGTTVPAIRWAYRASRLEPTVDVGPEHKGWDQRLRLGETRTRLTLQRLADAAGAPLVAGTDELSTWLELERQWFLADAALVWLRDDHPGLTWMMRIAQGPEWNLDSHLSESDIELVEVVR